MAEETINTDPILKPVNARCLKCKEPRVMQEPARIVMKNGRHAVRGKCADCGTSMFRIGRPE